MNLRFDFSILDNLIYLLAKGVPEIYYLYISSLFIRDLSNLIGVVLTCSINKKPQNMMDYTKYGR